MKTVKVKVAPLLEKIEENRGNHRTVFEQALIVYKRKVIEELEASLARAKEGERITRYSTLTQPMDMTDEYDQAVAMLKMSVDEEVVLTNSEFACFVLDKWQWKSQFASSNRGYVEEYNRLPEFTQEGERPANYGRALDY